MKCRMTTIAAALLTVAAGGCGSSTSTSSTRASTLAPIHGDQTPYCLFVENTIAMTQLLSAPSRRRGAAGGRGTGSE